MNEKSDDHSKIITLAVSIVSLITAFISLSISFKSCSVTEHYYYLSHRPYVKENGIYLWSKNPYRIKFGLECLQSPVKIRDLNTNSYIIPDNEDVKVKDIWDVNRGYPEVLYPNKTNLIETNYLYPVSNNRLIFQYKIEYSLLNDSQIYHYSVVLLYSPFHKVWTIYETKAD